MLAKVVAAVQGQRPKVETTWTVLLRDNAVPNKERAAIQYLEGEKLQVLPYPSYSLDLALYDCWLLSAFKGGLAGKTVCLFWLVCCYWRCCCCCFANSRPCKNGDLTTSCNTLFGQTQRLPKMAKATAALWTAAESTLKIHDNFIAASGFCFAMIEQFAQRDWP